MQMPLVCEGCSVYQWLKNPTWNTKFIQDCESCPILDKLNNGGTNA